MLCYIGVGSNVGDRLKNIQRAIEYLHKLKGISVKRCSSLYETEPMGVTEPQEDYLNLVLEIASQVKPKDLLRSLKRIERDVGRRMTDRRWSSREVDLDILLCGDVIIKNKNLQVPHPLMHKRFFVLKPLSDLAPYLRHPLLDLEVGEMLASLKETGRWHRSQEGLTDICSKARMN